ncbi:response regulator [Aliidongia sp.]|uniref:response regulator n=1 Tax=Aliidongia sp. TaxID=1914230 RepID=UPI002DDD8307|nr:response regulator [Aliidongia sp.]
MLVVDDTAPSRRALRSLFETFGIEVSEADSAHEALTALDRAAARGAPFDLAIIDQMMPGMPDVAAATRLRSNNGRIAMRLILAAPVDSATSAHCDAILAKPIQRAPLLSVLEGLFDIGGTPPVSATPRRSTAAAGLALLLVEDNRINQMVAATLLEGDGYAVTIAEDGIEALEKAALERFDAILMDVQMPRLDGIEATRRLRGSTGLNQTTPIIALTANALEGDRERYLSAGMNDYLSKPFELDAVRAVVARWIVAGQDDQAKLPRTARATIEPEGVLILDDSRLAGLETRIAAPKFAAMIRAFLDNADQRLRRMADAIARDDLASLEREAHSLAGAAANVGAVQLAAAARRIETTCRSVEGPSLGEEIDRLRPVLSVAQSALSDRFLPQDTVA